MADLGITDFEDFDFISQPGREGIIAAIETLNLLDALEHDRTLSKTGRLMTEFPLLPRQSRIIVEAILKYPQVIRETVIAVSFLSTQSPYVLPPGEETDARLAHHSFRDSGGDFLSYLKLFYAYTESANKQKFCEKNYLDERTMAEIQNISEQLEQIISDMKIPLLSGGSSEDYLCAIGRGLVQFICVREGRDHYRSLTADKILIHPGSVMFHRNQAGSGKGPPEYIVAGEIVRTTRMYAMSVSPLSRSALEKISPILYKSLGRIDYNDERSQTRGNSGERKLKRSRDFTNNIKIGNEIFEMENVRGKKEVKLPWEKLKTLKDKINAETATLYRGLRGTIIINDKYSLLKGEKLSLILTLVPSLNPEDALTKKTSGGSDFNSHENLDKLLKHLPGIVTPDLWKQREGAKELGFSGLFTDGSGNYRIKCCRAFHTALSESIASLETLIDELGDDVDIEKKHIVNQCYRRLSDLL